MYYYVYILTNNARSTIYVGVTNNLDRRSLEHYMGRNNPDTFTGRYRCCYLVYFEVYLDISQAIAREKEIKKWRREKKNKIITDFNPEWKFLNEDFSNQGIEGNS